MTQNKPDILDPTEIALPSMTFTRRQLYERSKRKKSVVIASISLLAVIAVLMIVVPKKQKAISEMF